MASRIDHCCTPRRSRENPPPPPWLSWPPWPRGWLPSAEPVDNGPIVTAPAAPAATPKNRRRLIPARLLMTRPSPTLHRCRPTQRTFRRLSAALPHLPARQCFACQQDDASSTPQTRTAT